MKRRTKITVFVATMALTFGSLMAFVGPRHCDRGVNAHWQNHRAEAGCPHMTEHAASQN